MSCGSPHTKPCREVLEEVYLYLDGELAGETQNEIREHLDECGPCLRKFGLEKDVKALVARCCGNDPVPDTLRVRVLATLRTVRMEIDAVEFLPD